VNSTTVTSTIAPPAASAHCRAAAKPSTTATMVLSPLESLTKKERADKADYFTLMDANLEKIATALGCPPRS
jgi:ABC-type Zn uptake system ZnuABC Zn-binding protein ZnuA